MSDKLEKPITPRTTPSGLPRVRTSTTNHYLAETRRTYTDRDQYNSDLAARLTAIAEENPRVVSFLLYPHSITDLLIPKRVPTRLVDELSGLATAYELLKAQSIKNQIKEANQGACPKANQEAVQPAYNENNICFG